ncbi:lysoplasmalogenase [Streptomyces apricus]|uniref:Lysoplasmalogenase n=1 Tax=Streptomyces apricus TaxID=1828112 RepID=A0A5B0ANA8_9ACTN|nr:lysoplasmalogenase [Streptomyces apricus]KAA0931513.1 lysoplasmalogenase [Streptomyces apricus]
MNERHARVALVAFGLVGASDLFLLAVGGDTGDLGHTLAKPLLMPLLAAHAYLRGGPALLVGALLCGWGGDVLLLLDAEPAFLAGMASFAAGHVCYLLLFARRARKTVPRVRVARATTAAYALAPVVTVALLWPHLPAGLRVPVAAYSLLLTAMAYGAGRLGPAAAAGGVLFLLSDTLIATGVADLPQLPRPDLWIMLTYLAAQSLLVRGALADRAAPAGHTVTSGSAPARP